MVSEKQVSKPLEQLCRKIGSGATPKGGSSVYTDDGSISLIRSQNVQNNSFSTAGLVYIDDKAADKLANVVVEKDDVLLNITGDSVARCCQVDNSILPARVNQHVAIIRPRLDALDARYLRYFLVSQPMQNYMLSLAAAGATRNALTKGMIEAFEIPLPRLNYQKAIAHILGTLDDKIELNLQMNATLEAMAQALFKSWFVDFDPVIDNALAAGNPIPESLQARAQARTALGDARKPLPEAIQKQFPNQFVFHEEMGWVPEGWEVGTLLSDADLISGGTPKTSIEEYWDGEIPWASAKDISQCGEAILNHTERKITKLGLDRSSTKLIGKYSTAVVSRGATTGRMAMVGDNFAMNQTCYALRSKCELHFTQYCLAKEVISRLVNAAHGSIFNTITTETFESTNNVRLPRDIATAFESRVSCFFFELHNRLDQVAVLSSLRDTLLPKLLSGELRIPDAEKQVADAL